MMMLPAGVQGAVSRAAAPSVQAAQPKFDWRLLLGALSSMAPHVYEARQSRRAQEELLAGEQAAQLAQRNADARIGDEVMKVQQSNPEAERAAAQAEYTRAVRQARDQGDPSAPSTTLGSTQFKADAAAAKGAQAAYGNTAANRFARIDAPIRQRERENQGIARAGVDVKRELGRSSSADFLARLRAQNRGRVSPWATVLGNLGQRIAGNYQRPSERTVR